MRRDEGKGAGPLRSHAIVAALLLLTLGSVDRAADARAEDGPSPKERWAPLREASVAKLLEFADWCRRSKLHRCRADLCEQVLALDADNGDARKALRYEVGPSGGWVRDSRYKPPRNLVRKGSDYERRRQQLEAWFLEETAPLLVEQQEMSTEARRVRDDVLCTAVLLCPDSERFRTLNLEVVNPSAKDRKASPWLLLESVKAATRRPGMHAAAAKALKAVPEPRPGRLGPEDQRGGVPWAPVLRGRRVRVVGNGAVEELPQIHKNAEAAWPLFEYAFGILPSDYSTADTYVPGLTLYAPGPIDLVTRFLAAQPEIPAQRAPDYVDYGYCGLQRPAFVLCRDDRAVRLESAARAVLQEHAGAYLNIGFRRAWAHEGLGLYLTYHITRTRLLHTIHAVRTRYRGDPEAVSNDELLAESEADWLAVGEALLGRPDAPDLLLLPGKDFSQLTREDRILAYCAVAYVVEGWPDRCTRFFKALARTSGSDLDQTLLDVFGYGAPTLQRRLHRWLRETHGIRTP